MTQGLRSCPRRIAITAAKRFIHQRTSVCRRAWSTTGASIIVRLSFLPLPSIPAVLTSSLAHKASSCAQSVGSTGSTAQPVHILPRCRLSLQRQALNRYACISGHVLSTSTLPNARGCAGGYVTNLNKAIEGSDMDKMAIEEIVKATWNDGQPTASFNNAAQVWSASHLPLHNAS